MSGLTSPTAATIIPFDIVSDISCASSASRRRVRTSIVALPSKMPKVINIPPPPRASSHLKEHTSPTMQTRLRAERSDDIDCGSISNGSPIIYSGAEMSKTALPMVHIPSSVTASTSSS